ncbi:transmembrane protein, putative [Medicago truncatula]|uniref:Transmembrane protein, putative n=1 Tax=Medicago truncatula TaxID=3880 RepID=A0A072UQM0_MEDTR|nr:transmembrane protein, putative [Medicago truncatula]
MVDDRVVVPVNANQNEFPMVIITDNKDEFSIFPPINHENLQLLTNQQIPQSKSPPSPSFSPSDCDAWEECLSLSSPFDSSLRKGCDFIGWLSIGFQILRSKLVSAVSSFRNRGGTNWSFGLRAATVVFIVMVLIRRRKNGRRTLTPNESRLMQIIMEKEGVRLNSIHYF